MTNPYKSPVIPPPGTQRDEPDTAVRLLTEIRDHQVEMLAIYRRTAATSRIVLGGAMVLMVLAVGLSLAIFTIKMMSLPNSQAPASRSKTPATLNRP